MIVIYFNHYASFQILMWIQTVAAEPQRIFECQRFCLTICDMRLRSFLGRWDVEVEHTVMTCLSWLEAIKVMAT